MVEEETIKKFNTVSVVFLIELITLGVSAYPLFMIKGYTGVIGNKLYNMEVSWLGNFSWLA